MEEAKVEQSGLTGNGGKDANGGGGSGNVGGWLAAGSTRAVFVALTIGAIVLFLSGIDGVGRQRGDAFDPRSGLIDRFLRPTHHPGHSHFPVRPYGNGLSLGSTSLLSQENSTADKKFELGAEGLTATPDGGEAHPIEKLFFSDSHQLEAVLTRNGQPLLYRGGVLTEYPVLTSSPLSVQADIELGVIPAGSCMPSLMATAAASSRHRWTAPPAFGMPRTAI